jgi:Fic family protein
MRAPTLEELLSKVEFGGKIASIMASGPTPNGRYLHWDELRHREPPDGLTHMEWWAGVRFTRAPLMKDVPLRDKEGRSFAYMLADPVLRLLHEIDQNASGGIQLTEEVTNPAARDRYIVNSLIEESITSSQLEGASTTAEVAREMIRSGRKPIDRSEWMILNNFTAMRFVQENRREPLTPALVFELHRLVTQNTLDDPNCAGAFRCDDDKVVVSDHVGNTLHVPPSAGELPRRLQAMCDFANARPTDGAFMHPVIRAIVLHFWLGFDHPFVDGNGRTARALFYWSMLSDRYWLAEYISISRILKKAPSQYSRAFLHTETDSNDLTYFILYQLQVIARSIEELKDYLRKKMFELREVQALLKRSADLNHRQLALLTHALKHPGRQYTAMSHQTSHNTSPVTARNDLLDLARRRLLEQRKVGRTYVFTAPADVADRLGSKRAEKPPSRSVPWTRNKAKKQGGGD